MFIQLIWPFLSQEKKRKFLQHFAYFWLELLKPTFHVSHKFQTLYLVSKAITEASSMNSSRFVLLMFFDGHFFFFCLVSFEYNNSSNMIDVVFFLKWIGFHLRKVESNSSLWFFRIFLWNKIIDFIFNAISVLFVLKFSRYVFCDSSNTLLKSKPNKNHSTLLIPQLFIDRVSKRLLIPVIFRDKYDLIMTPILTYFPSIVEDRWATNVLRVRQSHWPLR